MYESKTGRCQTCNWLDLGSLGSWPTMPKNFPGADVHVWISGSQETVWESIKRKWALCSKKVRGDWKRSIIIHVRVPRGWCHKCLRHQNLWWTRLEWLESWRHSQLLYLSHYWLGMPKFHRLSTWCPHGGSKNRHRHPTRSKQWIHRC